MYISISISVCLYTYMSISLYFLKYNIYLSIYLNYIYKYWWNHGTDDRATAPLFLPQAHESSTDLLRSGSRALIVEPKVQSVDAVDLTRNHLRINGTWLCPSMLFPSFQTCLHDSGFHTPSIEVSSFDCIYRLNLCMAPWTFQSTNSRTNGASGSSSIQPIRSR